MERCRRCGRNPTSNLCGHNGPLREVLVATMPVHFKAMIENASNEKREAIFSQFPRLRKLYEAGMI